jgi:alkylation response protein AidB-like acyl-CoA dehydrogenase
MAVQEMWQSANMSFALCPMLNQGAVEALTIHGSDELKEIYLGKLISGEWTGTMNLTEPQAGSDLAAIRTKAVREDGHYRISGQKIYITYGEHDFTENIIHMVLARMPDAPPGIKGISLFVVPKFLVNSDGSLGDRNDLRCVSLEHKLGIKASPTAVMAFGDNDGAIGYLVGEENRGIEYMFTMMNNARMGVGLQGVAISERAYQQARDYARTRVQSRDMADAKGEPVAIIRHPDVRRMLMTMRSQTEAARALTYYAVAALDIAKKHPDPEEAAKGQALADLLTPVVKAWSTDLGVENASIGIQIHGGMGFIEETGAAQHLRDARITPIYEGTNGIQANDLVFRKVIRDGGTAARILFAEIRETIEALKNRPGDDMAAIAIGLGKALDALEKATTWLVENGKRIPTAAASGAAHYLKMFGIVTGGFLMAKGAMAAQEGQADPSADQRFLDAKLITARFFADQFLPQAVGLLTPITEGHLTVTALSDDQF